MIQTVTGPVEPGKLGIVSLHEHIICGSPLFYRGFGERWADRRRIVADAAAQLAAAAAAYGLKTVVDGTPFALGRDVALLREVAEKAGVNLIASTGYYVTADYGLHEIPAAIQAAYFIDECNLGIEGTGIRPGFLKCAADAGTSLRGAEIVAMVQKETGLPLFAHSDARARTGLKLLEVFEKQRLDPEKIVIGHVGDSHDPAYVEELLHHGCFVCIDRLYQPDDIAAKAQMIVKLAERGFLEQITVAHDHICWKMERNRKQQAERTDRNLNHIGELLIPELRKLGFGDKELEQLLAANPRRILSERNLS